MTKYRLGIALTSKGALNYMHKVEIVEAFRGKGAEVVYLVREDYMQILEKIPGCEYTPFSIDESKSRTGLLRWFCFFARSLYSAKNIDNPLKNLQFEHKIKLRTRVLHSVVCFFAKYRWLMSLIVLFEGILYRGVDIKGAGNAKIDQLLLRAMGGRKGGMETSFAWWARRNGIAVVQVILNYDVLTSKGFLGSPIEKILVWGESMRKEAAERHGAPEEKIVITGSLNYFDLPGAIRLEREAFLKSIGLDPDKRTILFAGPIHEFHYFEMLDLYKKELDQKNYQMIFRIYPDPSLLNSPFIAPMLKYANDFPGVYVDVGDFDYNPDGGKTKALNIERDNLWHSFAHSDVVINVFSTIALEACIFDKPVIHMWYFYPKVRMAFKQPVYQDRDKQIHNLKLTSVGAAQVARNRKELLSWIEEAIENPELRSEARRNAALSVAGVINEKTLDRVVDAIIEDMDSRNAAKTQ